MNVKRTELARISNKREDNFKEPQTHRKKKI